ncbi:MAG: ATP-binding protein, partial [Bacteroidetes bacterium]|nr:ATP-binding protein [Bacteroidota bacterium]
KPPEILVRTNSDNSHLYVTFTDNGIGISKEHLQNIFEKYYRVPTGNIHDVKGYGLGLSYVRIVVESAGGEIKVSSKPDKGTTFKISFPLSQIN